jgi:hypothetical protein
MTGAFTMTLIDLVDLTGGEIAYEDVTYDNVEYKHHPVITGGNIGFEYFPIFEEGYRPILQGKIFDRFQNREIGSESIEMFQLHLRRKLAEVMPYFNKLYETEKLDYDALSTMDITTQGTVDTEEETSATATSNAVSDASARSRAVNSVTPQVTLSPDEDYATSAADSNSTNESNTESESTNVGDSTGKTTTNNRVTGYQAIPATLVMRYRESLLNIDLMILNEIEECFMQVFDNGDAYFNNNYIF